MTVPIARRWSTWVIAVPTIPTYLVGLILLAYELAARTDASRSEGAEGLRTWLRADMRRDPQVMSVDQTR
jgi:hypothetical protein